MDIEKLLFRANSGEELRTSEIAAVVTVLRGVLENPQEYRDIRPDDVYGFLLVVGRSKAFEHRSLLERFLENDDPLIVSLVLEILCLQWGWTTEYLERVVNFALGVSWDSEYDLRQTAVKILGNYLGSQKSSRGAKRRDDSALIRQIAQLLLETFGDTHLPKWTRSAAYSALCKAAGWQDEDLPAECAVLDLNEGSADINPTVISYVRGLAEGEAGSTEALSGSASLGTASPGTR